MVNHIEIPSSLNSNNTALQCAFRNFISFVNKRTSNTIELKSYTTQHNTLFNLNFIFGFLQKIRMSKKCYGIPSRIQSAFLEYLFFHLKRRNSFTQKKGREEYGFVYYAVHQTNTYGLVIDGAFNE